MFGPFRRAPNRPAAGRQRLRKPTNWWATALVLLIGGAAIPLAAGTFGPLPQWRDLTPVHGRITAARTSCSTRGGCSVLLRVEGWPYDVQYSDTMPHYRAFRDAAQPGVALDASVAPPGGFTNPRRTNLWHASLGGRPVVQFDDSLDWTRSNRAGLNGIAAVLATLGVLSAAYAWRAAPRRAQQRHGLRR